MAVYTLAKLGWKDSEGNRRILDLTNKGSTPTGPKPTEPGYGTGIYEGDDLEESLDLAPMEGTDNPSHDNYGNYQNSDGSIFVFIPKFYYSFNCKPEETYYQDTLTYSGLTEEQLAQIVTRSPLNYIAFAPGSAFKNEAEANSHGFILHRAFIDGGIEKSGFFIMKYLASKGTSGTSSKALSVKNGYSISLTTNRNYHPSSSMPNCMGAAYDAITLSKAINPNLNCASAFMYSALAMQSKFIGTIAISIDQCAWYDSSLVMNFPKGCNNDLSDINDSSVSYTIASRDKPKTGSGTPFAKTTHNGLNNGVADLNGCMSQVVTSVGWNGSRILKDSSKLSDITTDNVNDQSASIYDSAAEYNSNYTQYWGNPSNSSWRKAINGTARALEGVYPNSDPQGFSSSGTNEFGQDYCYDSTGYPMLFCGGSWLTKTKSGIFFRSISNWSSGVTNWGFRSGGYALN